MFTYYKMQYSYFFLNIIFQKRQITYFKYFFNILFILFHIMF